MQKRTSVITSLFYILISLTIASCGGGGGGDDAPPNITILDGKFVDSAVKGVEYSSGGQTGLTDDAGGFKYEKGKKVRFNIGGINIGEANGGDVITPVDLVAGAKDETHPVVTNIAKLILTLDDDADPDNGVQITDQVRASAQSLSVDFEQGETVFENDGALQIAVAQLTALTSAGTRSLISSQDTQNHLQITIARHNGNGRSKDIEGAWELIALEGSPTPVDASNSVWTFNTNGTYDWYLNLDPFDLQGGGNFNLEGSALFIDGIVTDTIVKLSNNANVLVLKFVDDTFSFVDDEGDRWTYRKVDVNTDVTPPETSITSMPDDPTNETSASFSFTANEAGSTFACELDGAGFSACVSPTTYNGLAGTTHTFSVQATDLAGNTDPTPSSKSWTIDLINPDTVIDSGPASTTNATSAVFDFSSNEIDVSYECSIDGGAYLICTDPQDFTGLSQGAHSLLARAIDQAGNIDDSPASWDWTIDTTAPDTTINSGPDDPTNSTSATFTFSSNEAGSTFECNLDGGGFSSCVSPVTYNALAVEAHNFQVRATDVAGNTDATPAMHNWTIDTTLPDTTINSGPDDPTNITSATFTFSSNEPDSTFECDLDGDGFSSCISPVTYNALAVDVHNFQVRATDVAGNTDITPAQWNWEISGDAIPPTGTSIVINSQATYAVSVSELTVKLTATDNIGITKYLVTEHNATDPFNIIPPILEPLISDSRWLTVTETTSFNSIFQYPLTLQHQIGDTVQLCAWFMDAQNNISEQICDTIVYGVDWESGQGNWFADNGVWQVGTPTAGPSACFSGSQCAGTVLDGNYPNAADSRLISATLTLPTVTGSEEAHLRFWQWFSYASQDGGQVQVSVWDAGTSTWSAWANAGSSVQDVSALWSLKDVDLTPYAGETVRIGFLHGSFGTAVSTGWYIDDINIVIKAPAFTGDFESGWDDWGAGNGVWQVGTPTAGPSACFSGSQCAGTVLDGNYPNAADSRLISATLTLPTVTGSEEAHLRFWQWFSYASQDGGQVQVSVWDAGTSTWSAWANAGSSVQDVSALWSLKDVDLTPYAGETVRIGFLHGSFGTAVSTGWYIDDINIVIKAPAFTGDFESGWDDWGAGNGVWQVGTPTAGPSACFSGSQCAGTVLDGNYPNAADSRLISATLTLPTVTGSEEAHLRFWQWFSYASQDGGQVQVSVWDAGTSTWSAWANAGSSVQDVSALWSLKDVDLTPYAGETVRIGFLHGSFGTAVSTGWYIDDINIVIKAPAFTGDFESGWDDWGAGNGVWQVGTPTAGPSACFSGSQCAGTVLDGNYPNAADSRLISATLTLPTVTGSEEAHLRFWQWFSYASQDGGQVQVSVWDAGTSTWSAWANAGSSVQDVSALWSLKDVDLTPYAGETVRIGFLHGSFGTAVSTGWYIDDILIQKL